MPAKLAKSAGAAKPIPEHEAPPSHLSADLLAWYERHARILPWRVGPAERSRGLRPDPYRVWLSEIMLQQTTVKAVAPFFQKFLARWPTIHALAAADESDIMAAWAGLGYYSRARNLIAAARTVAAGATGRLPRTAAELAQLPGVGVYTSAAIAALAFAEPVAVVDGNVERVIARLFAIETPLPAAKSLIRNKLQPLVPQDRPGEFAEALMDLGATICSPSRPACALCPWFQPCIARQQGRQAEYPMKAARKARPTRYGTAFVARRADGAILLRRRPPKGLLGGMSEVPGDQWQEGSPGSAAAPLEADWTAGSAAVEHTFTHFHLKLTVQHADVGEDTPPPGGHWWASAGTLSDQALPSVMKKAIEAAFPGATRPARRA
jgi:A/G-specific adenine glycosylase